MLPQRHRITSAGEYRATARDGRRHGGAVVVTHTAIRDPQAPARFGFVVAKAVGGAVQRNLVKRRLRAIGAERIADGLSGVDVVVRALPGAAQTPYAQLRADVVRQLERAS